MRNSAAGGCRLTLTSAHFPHSSTSPLVARASVQKGWAGSRERACPTLNLGRNRTNFLSLSSARNQCGVAAREVGATSMRPKPALRQQNASQNGSLNPPTPRRVGQRTSPVGRNGEHAVQRGQQSVSGVDLPPTFLPPPSARPHRRRSRPMPLRRSSDRGARGGGDGLRRERARAALAEPGDQACQEGLLDQRALAAHHGAIHHGAMHPGLAGASDEPRDLRLDHRTGEFPPVPGSSRTQVSVLSLA